MRIIVKVGSNLLKTQEGDLDLGFLSSLAREFKLLKLKGISPLLVSSGAVLLGSRELNKKPKNIVEKQALSGIGQAQLMGIYREVFGNYGLKVAQILLTNDVFKEKVKFNNVKDCLEKILEWGIVPIINENDTVAVSEVIFGDNDFLAVYVGYMLEVSKIILLSSAGGLLDERGEVVREVRDVKEALKLVKGERSEFGSGGMRSKLLASEIASYLGIEVIIAGKNSKIGEILEGKGEFTKILPKRKRVGRSKVLKFLTEQRGIVYIDEGALKALKEGKSLLPVGVKGFEGNFNRGDVVLIVQDSLKVGKGKINFSSQELSRIMGKRGEEVKRILKTSKEEVIHRDNLLIF